MQIGYFLQSWKDNIIYYMDNHCKIEMQNTSVIQEDKYSQNW